MKAFSRLLVYCSTSLFSCQNPLQIYIFSSKEVDQILLAVLLVELILLATQKCFEP